MLKDSIRRSDTLLGNLSVEDGLDALVKECADESVAYQWQLPNRTNPIWPAGNTNLGHLVDCLRCSTRVLSLDAFFGRASPRREVQLRKIKTLLYALSRGLRILLAHYLRCPPNEIELVCGPKGKPELRDPSRIRFNASHSGQMALYALVHCRCRPPERTAAVPKR